MYRIIYVLRSMAMLAGTERVVSDKINWLANIGHEVTLVTYEQGTHPLAFSLHPSVRVIDLDTRFFIMDYLPLYRRFLEYLRMKNDFRKRLKKVVDYVNPNIILTTTYSLKVADEIIKVKNNAKLIIESHETCFSVCKEYDYRSRPIMRLFAKLFDKKYFKLVNNFDRVVTLTKGDANEWSKRVITKIEVIPNPLTYYPSNLPQKTESHLGVIVAVGRFEEVKGFDLLISAFSKIAGDIPQWNLDIYGKGSQEDSLKKLISKYKLENRVSLKSPIINIFDVYSESDIFVLSSRHEGLGMALIEAMACGVPCVSFNCEYGPAEIVANGKTGLLVDNGNIIELAKSIHWMIEHPDERLAMGMMAHKSVKSYNKDYIMQRWVDLFDDLLR